MKTNLNMSKKNPKLLLIKIPSKNLNKARTNLGDEKPTKQ
jgi:hypothetical protein